MLKHQFKRSAYFFLESHGTFNCLLLNNPLARNLLLVVSTETLTPLGFKSFLWSCGWEIVRFLAIVWATVLTFSCYSSMTSPWSILSVSQFQKSVKFTLPWQISWIILFIYLFLLVSTYIFSSLFRKWEKAYFILIHQRRACRKWHVGIVSTRRCSRLCRS